MLAITLDAEDALAALQREVGTRLSHSDAGLLPTRSAILVQGRYEAQPRDLGYGLVGRRAARGRWPSTSLHHRLIG